MILSPRPRIATLLIPEVSDATEIKSLPENSNNATLLTDETPERDLLEGPESKSQQLGKIVG